MHLLILPHQLFNEHPGLEESPVRVTLWEHSLFFGDPKHPAYFHKQKLWLHRATMKRYLANLDERGIAADYIEHAPDSPKTTDEVIEQIAKKLRQDEEIAVAHPTDFLVEKRLHAACRKHGVELRFLPNPGFLNTTEENQSYRGGKNRWYMADFYQWQRRRFDILIEDDEPVGGQWSFDEDNRKKIPKKLLNSIPENLKLERDEIDTNAKEHVETTFANHPGSLDDLYYPTSHDQASQWLDHFLSERFENFGPYEDAIEEGESWLWHSVLTPALNIGLLTPAEVTERTIQFASKNDIPINSVEGFIRQIIGWREFMRATYEDQGVSMRTANHWKHHQAIPDCFYDASTGIDPIDDTIARLLKTGYCHHIERLMVLGGFMFLCEIDPDDVYRWFMEMFIDSYDWVMVTNVYGMSQDAAGGMITTKPYFSGSSYVRKMSHYAKGPWCETWDGLYWRWIWNHSDELAKNPRWAMMCSMAKKMDSAKRERHIENAESFLAKLDQ
ncbi:cryptochrome/photolyase family protein [Rhodopirellula sallentina]|uniref:Deoxyribodipyrimidine photolyase-related protein n=1 Tax=Rhodopirellula sallentina SM41 TaxID=1263870 RepID=M5TXD6_9BACT|nr:cryptochrome/photolyase family protein [Rhodopirellula sallentina]EMI53845.1 Deoxyribodipyrimidine photolyase-related protein [Rhodopirellula sallentina SM41]